MKIEFDRAKSDFWPPYIPSHNWTCTGEFEPVHLDGKPLRIDERVEVQFPDGKIAPGHIEMDSVWLAERKAYAEVCYVVIEMNGARMRVQVGAPFGRNSLSLRRVVSKRATKSPKRRPLPKRLEPTKAKVAEIERRKHVLEQRNGSLPGGRVPMTFEEARKARETRPDTPVRLSAPTSH